MSHVPESTVGELLQWIACERDAAWAAKLAILRARALEDISYFGACLREHDRHAEELAQLVRAASPRQEIPQGPCFVVRDALVVGALEREDAVLDAMKGLEEERIERYERRLRCGDRAPLTLLDALLERHLTDARSRRDALQRRRNTREPAREAAA
jgi:hypothetical protein